MASVFRPDNQVYIIYGALDVHGELTVSDSLLNVDNVRINSTNDVDLDNIPATFNDADAALNIQGGAWIGGNLYTGGTFVANGDIVTLGNANGSLTLNGNISSDVLPSTTNTYNIGSSSNQWATVNTSSLNIESNPQVITNSVHTDNSSLVHVTDITPSTVILNDGVEGQLLHIICTVSNSVQVSPVHTIGYTSFTFTNAGDSITMIFTGGAWAITSNFRTSVS